MDFPNNWQRVCAITIDHTKVPVNVVQAVLLLTEANVPSEMLDGGAFSARSDGGDIRFSSDPYGATQIAGQIVSITTGGSPALEAWVKVPYVSATVDTTYYIWYHNPDATMLDATDTYGSQACFTDFEIAYHCNKSGSSNPDSTPNENHGTLSGTTTDVAGKIGRAIDFNGTTGKSVSVNNIGITTGDRTLCFWVSLDNTNQNCMAGWGSNVTRGQWNAAIRNLHWYLWAFGTSDWDLGVSPPTGTWVFVVVTYEVSTNRHRYYINGVEQTAYGSPKTWVAATTNAPVELAHQNDIGTEYFMNGRLDEVYIFDSLKPATWVTYKWNMMSDPGSFSSAGTPESRTGSFLQMFW
jgi:hypothetical protein